MVPHHACDASRRAFCAATAAGAGLLALGLPACDDGGSTRIMTGGVDNQPGNNPPPDSPDMAQPPGTNGGTTGSWNGTTGGLSGNTGGTSGGNNGGTTGGTSGGTTGGSTGNSTGASCSGNVSGGNISSLSVNSAKNVTSGNADIWLCRDSQGVYALRNYCTHAGCPLDLQSDNTYYCGCHGATFDANGDNPTSPAYRALTHYAVCIDSSGNIQINTASKVVSTTRTPAM